MASAAAAAPAAGGSDDPGQDAYILDYLKKHDNKNIMMVIMRSTNKNIVCYEGKVKDGSIDSDSPVDAYWLDIDPEYQKKNRKKGKEDDRVELGFAERNMAYGQSAKANDDGTYTVTLQALKSRPLVMSLDDGRPRLQGDIGGKPAWVDRIYVEAKSSWTGPKVLFVNIYGESVADGKRVMEQIKK